MYKATFILMLSLTPVISCANDFTGTVVGILSGDTVFVLNQQAQQIKIRMSGLDAPEEKQAFNEESKSSLSEMCFFKEVVVTDSRIDIHGETLGRLNCAGIDANTEQVKRGMAWAYQTDKLMVALEDVAKDHRIGLWKDSDPYPPWSFQRDHYISGHTCYEITESFREYPVDMKLCFKHKVK